MIIHNLVRLYVDRLHALGARAEGEQVWREYRLYVFSGVPMAVIASTNGAKCVDLHLRSFRSL